MHFRVFAFHTSHTCWAAFWMHFDRSKRAEGCVCSCYWTSAFSAEPVEQRERERERVSRKPSNALHPCPFRSTEGRCNLVCPTRAGRRSPRGGSNSFPHSLNERKKERERERCGSTWSDLLICLRMNLNLCVGGRGGGGQDGPKKGFQTQQSRSSFEDFSLSCRKNLPGLPDLQASSAVQSIKFRLHVC